MNLKEMEAFIRGLAKEFNTNAADAKSLMALNQMQAKAKDLLEVADKLKDFQEFLDHMYEQNTGKKFYK